MGKQIEEAVDLLKADKPEEAGEAFMKMLSEHPKNKLAILGLIKVSHLYDNRNEPEKAVDWLDRALAIAERKSDLHIAAATVHIRAKNETKALESIREAMKANPGSPQILITALTYFARMDRFDDESREVAERLLATKKAPIDGYQFLGLWYQHNEQLDEARDYFLRAIFLDTNDMQSRLMMGKLYETMEKYNLAEREYIKMTKIRPRHFSGYLCLAELHQKTGDEDLAREYAQRASKLKEGLARFQQQATTDPADDKKQEKPE